MPGGASRRARRSECVRRVFCMNWRPTARWLRDGGAARIHGIHHLWQWRVVGRHKFYLLPRRGLRRAGGYAPRAPRGERCWRAPATARGCARSASSRALRTRCTTQSCDMACSNGASASPSLHQEAKVRARLRLGSARKPLRMRRHWPCGRPQRTPVYGPSPYGNEHDADSNVTELHARSAPLGTVPALTHCRLDGAGPRAEPAECAPRLRRGPVPAVHRRGHHRLPGRLVGGERMERPRRGNSNG
jgi:hypothetical protein